MKRCNRPSKEGAILGAEIARLTEGSIAAAENPERVPDRCRTCAFRLGTYPNRCWQTVVDAFGCIQIGDPFHCHERTEDDGYPQVCAGYLIAAASRSRFI